MIPIILVIDNIPKYCIKKCKDIELTIRSLRHGLWDNDLVVKHKGSKVAR